MTPDLFDYAARMLKERSGLIVTPDKIYLLETRLTPIARRHGHETVAALLTMVRNGRNERILAEITEAMTTNESSFFRDKTPFDQFKATALPTIAQARGAERQLRLWCAAASTGQEPYSLAMLLQESTLAAAGWRFEILATDLSGEVLERARAGRYNQFEIQRGLPVSYLLKHFKQNQDHWQIDASLRAMITWRQLNLVSPLPPIGPFDIVFCRNVLIYFDVETKKRVLESIARVMTRDAYLVLGASETVLGVTDLFRSDPDNRSLFRLR